MDGNRKRGKMKNEIATIDMAQYGLDEQKAALIRKDFDAVLKIAEELEESFNAVIVKEVTPEVSKEAKALRIKYMKVRTGLEEVRKARKAFYLSGGRAVDGLSAAYTHAVEGNEQRLKAIETHFEDMEKARIAKLEAERIEAASKFDNDARLMKLGEMAEDVWKNYILGVELSYNHRKAAEQKAEEERKAAAEAEAARQAEIQNENARLREEAEKARKAANEQERIRAEEEADRKEKEEAERKERLREQALREAELARIQAEHDEKMAKERKARELLEQAARKREADEKARIAEEAARSKDKEHKRQVNLLAAAGFEQVGLSPEMAVVAVKAVAQGKISNVVIKY